MTGYTCAQMVATQQLEYKSGTRMCEPRSKEGPIPAAMYGYSYINSWIIFNTYEVLVKFVLFLFLGKN